MSLISLLDLSANFQTMSHIRNSYLCGDITCRAIGLWRPSGHRLLSSWTTLCDLLRTGCSQNTCVEPVLEGFCQERHHSVHGQGCSAGPPFLLQENFLKMLYLNDTWCDINLRNHREGFRLVTISFRRANLFIKEVLLMYCNLIKPLWNISGHHLVHSKWQVTHS